VREENPVDLIKKNALASVAVAAVVAYIIGRMMGAKAATKAIADAALGHLRAGRVTEAIKVLGGTPAPTGTVPAEEK
jgi:hypothetical protein